MKTRSVTDLRTGLKRTDAPGRDWKQCARAMRAVEVNARRREEKLTGAARMLWAYARMRGAK